MRGLLWLEFPPDMGEESLRHHRVGLQADGLPAGMLPVSRRCRTGAELACFSTLLPGASSAADGEVDVRGQLMVICTAKSASSAGLSRH